MDDVDSADVITIDSVNLSPDLPAYDARANAYMEYVLARSADVIMVHGLRVGSTVLDAADEYSAHVGEDAGLGGARIQVGCPTPWDAHHIRRHIRRQDLGHVRVPVGAGEERRADETIG